MRSLLVTQWSSNILWTLAPWKTRLETMSITQLQNSRWEYSYISTHSHLQKGELGWIWKSIVKCKKAVYVNQPVWTLFGLQADFKLMCDNAMVYNRPETVYYKAAKKLLHTGFKMMSKVMRSCRRFLWYSITTHPDLSMLTVIYCQLLIHFFLLVLHFPLY